jgi:hypothetical protein
MAYANKPMRKNPRPMIVTTMEKVQKDFLFRRALIADKAIAIWKKVTPSATL